MLTFDAAMKLGRWMPIRDCPGRFVLRDVSLEFSIADLLGKDTKVLCFRSSKARDNILVVCFQEGGMISYRRSDGTYLHTLNTEAGLRRKLEQLEIRLAESDEAPTEGARP